MVKGKFTEQVENIKNICENTRHEEYHDNSIRYHIVVL